MYSHDELPNYTLFTLQFLADAFISLYVVWYKNFINNLK